MDKIQGGGFAKKIADNSNAVTKYGGVNNENNIQSNSKSMKDLIDENLKQVTKYGGVNCGDDNLFDKPDLHDAFNQNAVTKYGGVNCNPITNFDRESIIEALEIAKKDPEAVKEFLEKQDDSDETAIKKFSEVEQKKSSLEEEQ